MAPEVPWLSDRCRFFSFVRVGVVGGVGTDVLGTGGLSCEAEVLTGGPACAEPGVDTSSETCALAASGITTLGSENTARYVLRVSKSLWSVGIAG